MSKELFEKRKIEFKEFVTKEHKMPRIWEVRFSDNEDMRLWFNKISKIEKYKSFFIEINEILSNFDLKILSNEEKEQEFIDYINKRKQIPVYG